MSVKISGKVWDSKLPRDMKFIALANADHANHDGTSVYPSRKTIAEMTGYSHRSVQVITRQLVEAGILVRDGTSEYQTYKYKFDLIRLAGYEAAEEGGAETAGGAEKRINGGAESSPNPLKATRQDSSSLGNGLLFDEAEGPVLASVPGFTQEWAEFRKHRQKLRAPLTERAEELLLNTLAERPGDVIEALRMAMRKGWRSFEWHWFDRETSDMKKSRKAPKVDWSKVTSENALQRKKI